MGEEWRGSHLWLVSLAESLPGTLSPDVSMGDGRRFRQEVRDWLESSLDTTHTHTHTPGERETESVGQQ